MLTTTPQSVTSIKNEDFLNYKDKSRLPPIDPLKVERERTFICSDLVLQAAAAG